MKRQQRGVSILMALILVVMITSVIAGVAIKSTFNIKRSGMISHLDSARALNEGLLDYALTVLRLDSYQSNIDTLDEAWALHPPAYEVDGGYVEGYINELSSRFNLYTLNNANSFDEAVFERLSAQQGLSSLQTKAVIEVVRRGKHYSTIGVLVAAGLSEKVINQLTPFICFLPINPQRININVISPTVFAAYFNVSINQASEMLSVRNRQAIKTQAELETFAVNHHISHILLDESNKQSQSVIKSRFGVKSRFFQIVGKVKIGDAVSWQVSNVDRIEGVSTILSKRLSKLGNE